MLEADDIRGLCLSWRFGSGSKQDWRALAVLPVPLSFGPIGRRRPKPSVR
ncbi:MAG: hypothetical protein ACI841_000935, partial [Planctomycetota bacterium]